MPSTYCGELRNLGVPSNQIPAAEFKEKLDSGNSSFTLDIALDGDQEARYLVTFHYSTNEFLAPVRLTHYVATLYDRGTNNVTRCRTFPVMGETGVPTLREAKNMLQGRAVRKVFYPGTAAEYPAWLWLDFSRFDSNGQYKIQVAAESKFRRLVPLLFRYPIDGLKKADFAARLIDALHSGELVEVMLWQGGSGPKAKVLEYDPRTSLLKLYAPKYRNATINIHLAESTIND